MDKPPHRQTHNERVEGVQMWPPPPALLERLGPQGSRRAEVERLFQERRRGSFLRKLWAWRKPMAFRAVEILLRMSGAFARGQRALLAMEVTEHVFVVPGLPRELDGLRILHLSDLHLDFVPGLTGILADRLTGLSYDLTVFTGDFIDRISLETLGILESGIDRILARLKGPRYGILGNHDLLCVAGLLEAKGLPILLNESVNLPLRGATLGLVGVDDPHLYECHDLLRAAAMVPDGAFRLLLAHSPVIAEEAAVAGFRVCLCGHTHGGQICLPGLRRPNGGRGIPPDRVSGPWRIGSLQGYTSRGVGASGLPVRFRSRPEIVIHTLRAAENSPPFA